MPNFRAMLCIRRRLARLRLAAALAACGGGDSLPDMLPGPPQTSAERSLPSVVADWIAGLFSPTTLYANRCAAPRHRSLHRHALSRPAGPHVGREPLAALLDQRQLSLA